MPGEGLVAGDEVGVAAGRQPERGEDHGRRPGGRDHRELPAVGRLVEGGAGRIDHAGPRHEFTLRAHHVPGNPQSFVPRGIVDQLDVAGVHVDRRHDPHHGGPGHVGREALPVDAPGGPDRQQDRRHPADRPPGPQEGERIDGRFCCRHRGKA